MLRDQEDTVQKLANVLCDIPRLHKANTVLRDLNTLCNTDRLHKANTVLRDLNTLCNIPRLHKANMVLRDQEDTHSLRTGRLSQRQLIYEARAIKKREEKQI